MVISGLKQTPSLFGVIFIRVETLENGGPNQYSRFSLVMLSTFSKGLSS